LRMSKGMMGGGFEKSAEEYGTTELPNGGARVIAIRNPATGAVQPVSSDRTDPLLDVLAVRETHENTLSDNHDIHHAMDFLNDEEIYARQEDFIPELMADDSFSAIDGDDESKSDTKVPAEEKTQAKVRAEEKVRAKEKDQPKQPSMREAIFKKQPKFKMDLDHSSDSADMVYQNVGQPPAAAKTASATQTLPKQLDEVIVISVVSKHPKGFRGLQLFRLLEACGLHVGDMDIFHRFEYDSGEGPIQFSVANMVKPGNFLTDDPETFSTPGITFFLGLPGPDDAMKAFDFMLETAKCVATNLGGELKDELRSAMTTQTIEHSRQRVRDFERLQLSVRNV